MNVTHGYLTRILLHSAPCHPLCCVYQKFESVHFIEHSDILICPTSILGTCNVLSVFSTQLDLKCNVATKKWTGEC